MRISLGFAALLGVAVGCATADGPDSLDPSDESAAPAPESPGQLAKGRRQPQTLSVTPAPTNGFVSGSGISCPETCSATYPYGTASTLSATPAAGYHFVGWFGDCTGANSTCTLTMTAARAVSAAFAIDTYTLVVSTLGSGQVAGAGISCPGGACTATYPHGTAITLGATPDAGSHFAGWGGACTGSAPTCTVIMTQSTFVTASFTAS
jgi:uncharacterized repeat protein (TIGR02543 family)